MWELPLRLTARGRYFCTINSFFCEFPLRSAFSSCSSCPSRFIPPPKSLATARPGRKTVSVC